VIPVIFSLEARSEALDAFHWYEERRQGLGAAFRVELDAAIDGVASGPESFPIHYRDLRRVLVRRFPYAVYYRIYPELVIVVAVFHGKRNPSELRRRSTMAG
jgi:plasmid stabilization system protein ParE